MTKKHYIKFAALLSSFKGSIDETQRLRLIDEISDILESDNPNFDMERFLDACNVDN